MTRHGALACLALVALSRLGAQDDALGRAMHDEMARTMSALQLKQMERPYFVSYLVSERQSVHATAIYGSLVSAGAAHGARSVQVEVRVGDYTFDNTNAMSFTHSGS